MTRHTSTRQSGFSLVEMLVALAALSLLAGAGVMMTDVAINARENVATRDAEATALLRLRAILRSDLTQAAPRRPRDENGTKHRVALLGSRQFNDPDTFLGLVRRGWDNPSNDDRPSMQYVEYKIDNGRIERSFRRNIDGAQTETPQILIEGVRSVRVRYMQYDQWLDAWSGSASIPLPDAVQIEMDLANRGTVRQLFLLPEFGL